jgi:hypothetical protein
MGVKKEPSGCLACTSVTIKAKLRRFDRVSIKRRTRHSPPRFALCPARPKSPVERGRARGAR